MNQIRRSNFTAHLIALNRLEASDFKDWLLKPGMGFREADKWWGNRNSRATLHEGLDLAGFLDNAHNHHQLKAGTVVPPLYQGRLVNIIDDFLGQTVIIDHGITNREGQNLHGFYAHISAADHLKTGAILNEDQGLGAIAPGNHLCPPHLHISTVWIAPEFPIVHLTWADLSDQEGLRFCNPLAFL